jgi:hypothetical protein
MVNPDYTEWGEQGGSDINNWAYTWASGLLNITLI